METPLFDKSLGVAYSKIASAERWFVRRLDRCTESHMKLQRFTMCVRSWASFAENFCFTTNWEVKALITVRDHRWGTLIRTTIGPVHWASNEYICVFLSFLEWCDFKVNYAKYEQRWCICINDILFILYIFLCILCLLYQIAIHNTVHNKTLWSVISHLATGCF